MKLRLSQKWFAALLLLQIVGATAMAQEITYLPTPTALPDFHWQDDAGRNMSLADFHGKVVLLNIWATWCKPCLFELPSLDYLQQRYHLAGLEVVPIAIDKATADDIFAFYNQLGIRDLPVYRDPGRYAAEALHTKHVPVSYLINREGLTVAVTTEAADWSDDSYRSIIERELRKK